MDPLSQLLALMNVQSTGSSRLEADGDWSLRFQARDHIKFGAVLSGACWLTPDGGPSTRMLAGDCYLLTQRGTYTLASDPALPPVDGAALFRAAAGRTVRLGGADTVIIGDAFSCDSEHAPMLLDLLPALIHVPATAPQANAFHASLQLLAIELAQPGIGGALMTDRLGQVLLVQALRAHVAQAPADSLGWLGALADAKVGPALRLLHGNPAHAWKVAELAAAVAMSRSSFAQRFRALVGMAPLEYLIGWRMQLARRALHQGDSSVARIAATLGYQSESAFGHAFKRTHGCAPRHYRHLTTVPVTPSAAE